MGPGRQEGEGRAQPRVGSLLPPTLRTLLYMLPGQQDTVPPDACCQPRHTTESRASIESRGFLDKIKKTKPSKTENES